MKSTSFVNGALGAAIAAGALALAFGGCASDVPSTSASCPDLTGTYENESTPPGTPLAPFFFATPARAKVVTLVSENARIVATAADRQLVMTLDRDFACSVEGVRLTKTDTSSIRLPPLIVENQAIHYVFMKAADGSLRMIPHIATKGTSFGVPIATRREEQREEIRWRGLAAPRK